MEKKFETQTFARRLKSMFSVDIRRMFLSPFFYILVGIAFVAPVLILVMTTMMDGTVSTDPNGNEIVIQGFENVWQIIGTLSSSETSGESAAMGGMDMMAMCNINLVYFAAAVLVCLFVSDDFRSGYSKNLFTVRAKKTDYVLSKTLVCFISCASMLLAFFFGSLLGGGVSGISFSLAEAGTSIGGIVACLLAKIFLLPVFVAIFLTMSVVAKQKAWLSILLSLGTGMLLFMMIPMMTPLNATLLHVLLCVAGGALFALGLGVVSVTVLNKTSLV